MTAILAALTVAARLCAALPAEVPDLHHGYLPVCWELAYRAERHPGTSAPVALAVAWHESRLVADARTRHARGPLQYIPRYWQGTHPDTDWIGPGLDALAYWSRRPRPHCSYVHGYRPPRTCTADRHRSRLARRLARHLDDAP